MKAGRVDRRDRSAVREQIRKLAESYTPEWRFDTEHPDAGSAIGLIFADWITENIRRLDLLPETYHTELIDLYGIALKAAKPAGAVVIMEQEDGVYTGVPVRKGTQVIGEADDGEEIIFEFLHDVYVSNIRLCEALSVSGARDKIIPIYKRQEDKKARMPLFSYEREGIDRQALYFYHPYLFDAQERTVRLYIKGAGNAAQLLADREQFCFSYFSEDGYLSFDLCACEGDTIILSRSKDERKQQVNGQEMSVIRLEPAKALPQNLLLQSVEIIAEEQTGIPDLIYDGRKELQAGCFLPFGEQLSSFLECYIGQTYLFRQKGMRLTLSFDLSFGTYQEADGGRKKPDLRMIKRKPKPDRTEISYECRVQETAVEYYNGRGWKNLACAADIRCLFADESNAGRHEISFLIPYDWEPTAQGGYKQECIRFLAVRADHCYVPNVTYRYPILSNLTMRVSCDTADGTGGIRPCCVVRERGSRRDDITADMTRGENVTVFYAPAYAGDYAFFGFERKWEQGPVCFFFEMEKEGYEKRMKPAFSYSWGNGFKPLKVIDGTEGFTHSGTFLFLPPADLAKQTVGGIERFWLRIEDTEKYFSAHPAETPVVKRFYENAVSVQNSVTLEEQDYFIEQAAADLRVPLYTEKLLRAEVWVNEADVLSEEEMDAMLLATPRRVREERGFLGEREAFYVLWQETEDFDDAVWDGRCYRIDRETGEIVFGDGIRVKNPRNTRGTAFKIRPVCCDGSKGNVGPGAIRAFRGNTLFVDAVTNPTAAFGGSDREDAKNARKRGSQLLSGHRRLVSETDYVRECMFFSDAIAQAVCVCEGESVSLALLMRDYKNGSCAFRSIKEDLKRHLLECCEMTFREEEIRIVEPVFVRISVQLWLAVSDRTKSIEIRQRIQKMLEEYLEPVAENGDVKWRIGELPKENQLRARLCVAEWDVSIERMSILASYEDDTGIYEKELSRLVKSPFLICCGGDHKIYLSEERENVCRAVEI